MTQPEYVPGICVWCQTECGGTCLGLVSSTQMRPDDPAYWMLRDGHVSTPVVHRADCYICRDPEFAQMGMPLCRLCPACKTGHVAADDTICDDCGHDEMDDQFGPDEGEPAPAVEPEGDLMEPLIRSLLRPERLDPDRPITPEPD